MTTVDFLYNNPKKKLLKTTNEQIIQDYNKGCYKTIKGTKDETMAYFDLWSLISTSKANYDLCISVATVKLGNRIHGN